MDQSHQYLDSGTSNFMSFMDAHCHLSRLIVLKKKTSNQAKIVIQKEEF